MNSEIMTKRSPIVLIWKFAAVEAIGIVLYFLASLLGNAKYEFYAQLSFSNLVSYQAAKMLFLGCAQFAMTVYVFLSWYYENYIFSPGSVTHEHGVFFREKDIFPIGNELSVSLTPPGPLGRYLRYGSVKIESGGNSLAIRTIPRPEKFMDAIARGGNFENEFEWEEPDIERLLKEEEHERLEFKSSLRFDYKIGQVNRELEKAVMKTIAAFLNSKGGYLIIGVNDARSPLGLKNDYQTLQRKDNDGFENHFTQTFNGMIGPEFRHLLKFWFPNVNGHEVCVIHALPSPRPIYLRADNSEHFYMRTGNISTALKLSEIESYSRSRWPGRIS